MSLFPAALGPWLGTTGFCTPVTACKVRWGWDCSHGATHPEATRVRTQAPRGQRVTEPWWRVPGNIFTRRSFPQLFQSLAHLSLSVQCGKLLGYLDRNWNSSKISMYRKNSSFYKNQRLKRPIKASCPPPISTGLVPEEFWWFVFK